VLEAKGLNQVLGGILHPVSHLEDMLVSLEVCPLGALKDKNDEDWKWEEVDEPPKEELQDSILTWRSSWAKRLDLLELLEPDANATSTYVQGGWKNIKCIPDVDTESVCSHPFRFFKTFAKSERHKVLLFSCGSHNLVVITEQI
jgi:hypothetical protein